LIPVLVAGPVPAIPVFDRRLAALAYDFQAQTKA
jgi:hypothetical protein